MNVSNEEQKGFWEGFATHWVAQQADLDGLMAPVLDRVLEEAQIKEGEAVLDIGCGTGTSALRAAGATGPTGKVLGVDIAEPMLKRARELGAEVAQLDFTTADAATYGFASHSFDLVISRFGVMFFVDSVAAFENIRCAMKPGARLIMATWSYLDVNPWFRVPMYAAKKRLGAPTPLDPDGPGPLAFRDLQRVQGILHAAGYAEVNGWTETLELTPPGDLLEVAKHAASIGPASRALEHFEATEADVEAVAHSIATEFEGYMTAEGVRVPAAINFFTAATP